MHEQCQTGVATSMFDFVSFCLFVALLSSGSTGTEFPNSRAAVAHSLRTFQRSTQAVTPNSVPLSHFAKVTDSAAKSNGGNIFFNDFTDNDHCLCHKPTERTRGNFVLKSRPEIRNAEHYHVRNVPSVYYLCLGTSTSTRGSNYNGCKDSM